MFFFKSMKHFLSFTFEKKTTCKLWPWLRLKWSIWPYFFDQFGCYMQIHIYIVVFQVFNWLWFIGIVKWDVTPRKKSKGVKLPDPGSQIIDLKDEISCSSNSSFNRSIVYHAVWHVTPHCWNLMLSRFGLFILKWKRL